MQTLSIHCILKFFDLFGFLRRYLLTSFREVRSFLEEGIVLQAKQLYYNYFLNIDM